MSRLLVLAGGSPHAHDFAASGDALAGLVAGAGHHVARTSHPDEAAARLRERGIDALVVGGLWWRMQGEAYDRWRDEWSYATPDATRTAIDGFVRAGGGLVALHTAPICFDDWPGWRDILGAAWCWGTSSHPPYGRVEARVIAEHPVVGGLPAHVTLCDEVYGDLDLDQRVEVLAVARRTPGDVEQPVVWAHRHGAGRVVYDCFGHDAGSIDDPINAQLLRQSLAWVLGAL